MSDILTDLPPAMTSLNARPLFVMRLTVPPAADMGTTPQGVRRVAIVSGGVFEGQVPGLSGSVHAGGLDWITQAADRSVRLDARVVLETRAGDRIMMSYRGIRHGPQAVLDRLSRAEDVDPADYYFRTVPSFETGSAGFAWLNNIVAVGVGRKLPDGVAYSIFEIG